MPLESGFFTSSSNGTRERSFSRELTQRLVFYPSCIVLGEAAITLIGQGMILASVPSLSTLVLLSAISACLFTPIVFALKLLCDQYLSHNTLINHIGNALVYMLDIYFNIQCMIYLTSLLHRPVMSVYAFYAILGAGALPTIGMCLAIVLMIRFCADPAQLSQRNISENEHHLEHSASDAEVSYSLCF